MKNEAGMANDAGAKEELNSRKAEELGNEITDAMLRAGEDNARHLRLLQDLKPLVIKAAASLAPESARIRKRDELCWRLAELMPDFDQQALYETRSSLAGIAAATFLGWVCGGFFSTLFGLIGLGGEILRPVAIFLFLWLADYLCANPKARRIILGALGLGALTRFAAMAAGGLIRFTSFASLRQLALGGLVKPNFFKKIWLLAGAFFILVFLARKISGMNLASFRNDITTQISQRLRENIFILNLIGKKDGELAQLLEESEAGPARKLGRFSEKVLSILDSLPTPQRNFLDQALAEAGLVSLADPSENILVWDEERDSPLYETVGLVRNGQQCRILDRPWQEGETIRKGHVQALQ